MLELHDFVIQPYWENRFDYYTLAEEFDLGMEIISFAMVETLNDEAKYNEYLKAYRGEIGSFKCFKSMHGPFLDMLVHSPDGEVASLAQRRFHRAMATADELGCSTVVFHTGINPLISHPQYFKRMVSVQGQFWRKLLEEYPDISIVLENVWESDPLMHKAILKETDHPNLRVCFDCGHAHIFSRQPLGAWIEELGNNITYMHWNDNLGDVDSELAVGDGNIDWKEFAGHVMRMNHRRHIVFEVGTIENVVKSIEYLRNQGLLK